MYYVCVSMVKIREVQVSYKTSTGVMRHVSILQKQDVSEYVIVLKSH